LNCQSQAAGVDIAQGGSAAIFVFGQGIVSGTTYSISGSENGVTVPQPSSSDFHVSSGTPYVVLNVSVSASAPRGPRNIEVKNSAGELSVFVGGLNITAP